MARGLYKPQPKILAQLRKIDRAAVVERAYSGMGTNINATHSQTTGVTSQNRRRTGAQTRVGEYPYKRRRGITPLFLDYAPSAYRPRAAAGALPPPCWA